MGAFLSAGELSSPRSTDSEVSELLRNSFELDAEIEGDARFKELGEQYIQSVNDLTSKLNLSSDIVQYLVDKNFAFSLEIYNKLKEQVLKTNHLYDRKTFNSKLFKLEEISRLIYGALDDQKNLKKEIQTVQSCIRQLLRLGSPSPSQIPIAFLRQQIRRASSN